MNKLRQYLGDSASHTVPLIWNNQSFEPDVSWLLLLTVKANRTDADRFALFQKALGAGITVSGSSATFQVVPQDTENSPARIYYGDIQAQSTTTGEIRTVCEIELTLDPDVSRGNQSTIEIHTMQPGYPNGPAGPPNVLSVGTVTTGAAGSQASVAIAGTSPAQVLNITIPRGDKGEPGDELDLNAGSIAAALGYVPADAATVPDSPADVGLGNVDNTSDANKPVSTAQAAAITAAKDRSNHTGEQAVSTITGLQAELDGKQTNAVEFLERFGRHANGTVIPNGSAPEFGGNAVILLSGGSSPPTVVNRALEATAGTLIYYGQTLPNTSARFSLLLMAEVRANPNYTTGVTDTDLTLGINGKPFDVLGSFLNGPQCLHAQIRPSGLAFANFYIDSGNPVADDGTTRFPQPPVGKRFPIMLVVERSETRISMLGVTKVYRDSRYFDRITSQPQTGFFVEWGPPDSSTRLYWAIHSVAANCPAYEQEQMFFGSPLGDLGAEMVSRGVIPIQGRVEIDTRRSLTDSTPAGARLVVNGTGVTTVNGVSVVAGGQVFAEGGFVTNVGGAGIGNNAVARAPVNINPLLTASLSSAAGAETILKSTADITAMSTGDSFEVIYRGRLVGAGTKRIRLVKNAYGTVYFDAGTALDGLSGPFVLRFYRGNSTTLSHVTYSELTINGQPPILQVVTANTGVNYFGLEFRTTSADAGGIVLDLMKIEVVRVVNN